ncbi:MAG: ABC transporter substrate-binding protein, partial [Geminicoccaceae bacterium]
METRAQLRARGETEAIYDRYKPNEHDYTDLAARLERLAIDVLYVGGGPDAGRILRTVRERGGHLQLVGGDGLGMDEFWTMAGPMGEGTIFSSRPNVRARAHAAAVLARFRAEGLGVRLASFAVYAAVQVWAQAVERAGSLELTAVAETLRRGRFDTVLGRVAFDHKGDLEDAAWQWKVWTHGEYLPLEQVAAIKDHSTRLSWHGVDTRSSQRPALSSAPAPPATVLRDDPM